MSDLPNRGGGQAAKPILRREIEEAQRHTSSNTQAAKYLQVPYERYKKYAQLYGLFESHMNQSGIGVDKGWSKNPTSIPLREILAGNHPNYSRSKLKNRLIARKKLDETCAVCGFHERRITDGKVPLILSFKDGDSKHFALENLELLCYNCMFLTTGAPTAVYRKGVIKSLFPENTSEGYHTENPVTTADHYDPSEEETLSTQILTEEERNILLSELHRE